MKALKAVYFTKVGHFNHHSICAEIRKKLLICQKYFSASNFFMLIFHLPVTYLEGTERILWKTLREVDFIYNAIQSQFDRAKVGKLLC